MDFFKALISAVTPKLKDFLLKSQKSEKIANFGLSIKAHLRHL